MKKKIISLILSALMISSSFMTIASVSADETDTLNGDGTYEIYPIPQSISYDGEEISLDKVNISFSSSIDTATVNHAKSAFTDNGFSVSDTEDGLKVLVAVSDEVGESILPGDVDGDGSITVLDAALVQKYLVVLNETAINEKVADINEDKIVSVSDATYIQLVAAEIYDKPAETVISGSDVKPEVYPDLYEKTDAYILKIEKDGITIIGKNTDAAFYGVSTLELILEQCAESKTVKTLTVEDYSDAQFRGFIEGYYGIPWSDEDRISLMEFGGKFKANTYVFAPKDDAYHSAKWTELYPEDRLAEMKKMVDAGNASKCKFVWSIHPFMYNAITEANYDQRLETIKAKFEQLYSIGVRQFGILADDASSPVAIQNRICKDMWAWCEEKGDVYDLIFVPQGYNKAWSNAQYFADLMDGMPEQVQVMWTGDSVCGWVTQGTFDYFKQIAGREAFMWLNWPVNDINKVRMLMGKGEVLGAGVTGFTGILTNPMQQAEASKVSIFAIADYTWNRDTFDVDKSWYDSFKYIDEGAPDALYEFAKHNSDPSPNTHGLVLQESEELKPFLDEFTTALAGGDAAQIKEKGDAVVAEFEKIVDAVNEYREKGTNKNLKKELEPWLDSMEYISEAAIGFVKTGIALAEGNDEAACANYLEASAALTNSKNCPVQNISGPQNVEAGAKRIIPFVTKLSNELSPKVLAIIDPNYDSVERYTAKGVIKSSGFTDGYEGSNGDKSDNNLIDGNDTTYIWYITAGDNLRAGEWIGTELDEAKPIGEIRILQGKDASHGDIIAKGVIEYSTDGETYTELMRFEDGRKEITFDASSLNVTAKYIRLRVLEDTGKWSAFRSFDVYAPTAADASSVYTNIPTLAASATEFTTDTGVLTINKEITLKNGQYIGIVLPRIRDVISIEGVEAPEGVVIEVSENAVEWSEYKGGEVNARYIRYINKGEADATFNFTALTVKSDEIVAPYVSDTNFTSIEGAANAFDYNRGTKAWFKNAQADGMYFTYDLGQTIDLNKLEFIVYDGEHDFIRNADISVSEDGSEWTKVITIGDGTTDKEIGEIYGNHNYLVSYYSVKNEEIGGIPARYIKVELTSDAGASEKWVRFCEFEINDNEYRPVSNNPTYVAGAVEQANHNAEKMMDGDLATSYISSAANSSISYKVSENTNAVTDITVVQNPATISNATVKIRTGADTWQEIGTLSGSLNKITIPEDVENVFEIKFEWADVIPEIYEMFIVTDDAQTTVDKGALTALYNEVKDYEAKYYTEDSFAAFAAARDNAQGVIIFAAATEQDVNDALTSLQNAVKGLKETLADKTELNALIKTATDLDKSLYTDDSVAVLTTALEKANTDAANADLTVKQAEESVAALQKAIDSLVMKGETVKIAQTELTATAPNYHVGNEAKLAIDGNTGTWWHTKWATESPLPTIGEEGVNNYIEIDLGKNRYVNKVTYLPRTDSSKNGTITGYKIMYSTEATGDNFIEVNGGSGEWANDKTEKTASFVQVNARRIRLVATSTVGDTVNAFISAAEINVYEIVQ